MKSSIKRLVVILVVVMSFVVVQGVCAETVIDVSPNVLNIQSKSTVVTVHTDIAYSIVIGASVFLNDVAIDWWKSDDRGNFVAKFMSDEIKTLEGLIIGDYNTLVLTGYTTDRETFIGTQDILVIDNVPEGAGGK